MSTADNVVEGVVFDLDGLLLDTERLYLESFQAAAQTFGQTLTQDFFISLIGTPSVTSRKMLVEEFADRMPLSQFEEAWRVIFADIVNSHGVPLKTGVVDVLDLLVQHERPFAIATSSHRELVEETLASGGIRERFSHIVCGDEVSRGKPAPDIYLEACRRIDIAPNRGIAFEDSDVGLAAAYEAGLTSILVPDLKDPTKSALSMATKTFGSLSDALPWLEGKFTQQ